MTPRRRRRKPQPVEPKRHTAAVSAADAHPARARRAQQRQAVLERESHRQMIEYLNEHVAPGV